MMIINTKVEIILNIKEATILKTILDNLDDENFMKTEIKGLDRKSMIQLKLNIPYE